MEALVKLSTAVTLKIEGTDLKDLIEQITNVEEAVGAEPCGKCTSTNTAPRCRTVDTDKFYEIHCKNCNAVLQLGIHKKGGTLYKKKMATNDSGKAVKEGDKAVYLPNNGWLKWNYQTKQME